MDWHEEGWGGGGAWAGLGLLLLCCPFRWLLCASSWHGNSMMIL